MLKQVIAFLRESKKNLELKKNYRCEETRYRVKIIRNNTKFFR